MKINLIRKEEQEWLDRLNSINKPINRFTDFTLPVLRMKYGDLFTDYHVELSRRAIYGAEAGLILRQSILKLKSQGLT